MAEQFRRAGARGGVAVAREIERSGEWVSQLLLVTAVVVAVVGGALAL
jgi:hypothetical protein